MVDDVTLTSAGSLAPSGDGGAIPETIGPYRILGKLGEGGMGIVYEAEQDRPRRRVALKVMRGGHVVDEGHAKMFKREAETLARIASASRWNGWCASTKRWAGENRQRTGASGWSSELYSDHEKKTAQHVFRLPQQEASRQVRDSPLRPPGRSVWHRGSRHFQQVRKGSGQAR